MEFRERLNTYIDLLGCTTSELAEAAGLSVATISRYRSGDRTPSAEGDQLRLLARGIARLSGASGATPLDEAVVLARLQEAATGIAVNYDVFRSNLGALLGALSISNSELARALSYDPSYISRIISGSRRPADLPKFVMQVAGVIGRRYGSPARAAELAAVLECPESAVSDPERATEAVRTWLSSNERQVDNPLGRFLSKVDAFDLDAFAQSIGFDSLRVPTTPFQLPTTRTYTGIRQIMEAETDFLKATALSRSTEPVFIYSTMPLDEMTEDPDFPRKWAFGIAVLLRKGLHLNVVHDVDRPLAEMFVGLEGWVPMYMTGQISPYYLPEAQGGVFLHNLKVSGAAALEGRAVAGHHAEGRYVVTKAKDEVRAYALEARRILEHARPLMRIYREDDAAEFEGFVSQWAEHGGRRRAILSAPPIQTISPELLREVLEAGGVTKGQQERIVAYASRRRAELEQLLNANEVIAELSSVTREEFDEAPVSLSLAGLFLETNVPYTFEQYQEHLRLTQEFAKTHEGCELRIVGSSAFHNTQIVVCEGSWVLVTKAKAPTIHFVIEHPRMVEAFENFVPLA